MDPKNSGNMYKATKIWNECIYLFKNGMPVKRHRYHVRIFPDTFTGEEAANWLYNTLKLNSSYFGQDITKAQVIQLLNKFFKSGIFEGIKPAKTFKAGKHLYRFKSVGVSSLSDSHGVANYDPVSLASTSTLCSQPIPFENKKNFQASFQKNDNFNFDNREYSFDRKEEALLNDGGNIVSYPKVGSDINNKKHLVRDNLVLPSGHNKIDHCLECCGSSLQRLKNRLKIEMKNEFWKREDLKRDLLRRLVTEKILENHNTNGENEVLYETPVAPTTLSYSTGSGELNRNSATEFDSGTSCLLSQSDTWCLAENVHLEKHVKKLKNKYLGEYLMKAVLKRINSILGSHLKLANVIPYKSIESMWIVNNMLGSGVGSAELPPWIIDAVASLGFFGEAAEEEKYPGYYEDVFNVLCDNIIISCTGPLIPVEMNELILSTFQFLEKLNKTENNINRMTSSTEDLITDMLTPATSPDRKEGLDNMAFSMSVKNDKDFVCSCEDEQGVMKEMLPVDCCYETAFTSDIPVTRIIRHQKTNIKRARSVLSLKVNDPIDNEFNLSINKTVQHASMTSLKHSGKLFDSNLGNINRQKHNDSQNVNNNAVKMKRTLSSVGKRSLSCDNLKKLASKSLSRQYNECEESKYNCYTNYGMSSVVDECTGNDISNSIICENYKEDLYRINYVDAINDINRLVQHSISDKHPPAFSSIGGDSQVKNSDYCEKYVEEECTTKSKTNYVSSCECDKIQSTGIYKELIMSCDDFYSNNVGWLPYVEYLGSILFRNELLLLNPENRSKLNIVLFLIQHNHCLFCSKKDARKKDELLKKLNLCVLQSSVNDTHNDNFAIIRVIKFLVEHRQDIMRCVDDMDDHLLNIRKHSQIGEACSLSLEGDTISRPVNLAFRHKEFLCDKKIYEKTDRKNHITLQQKLRHLRM